MDKLSESRKAEVKKMSDTRLISKLMQAGYSSEQVEVMNRETLMSTWAEVIIAGKEASAAMAHSKAGYDPDIEKQRLAWEIKRYEEEKEHQKKKRKSRGKGRKKKEIIREKRMKSRKRRRKKRER